MSTFIEIVKSETDIEKFNPYHDKYGRFTFANGAASFTYAPGKSKAHDNAIAREKERAAASGGNGKLTSELEESISGIVERAINLTSAFDSDQTTAERQKTLRENTIKAIAQENNLSFEQAEKAFNAYVNNAK